VRKYVGYVSEQGNLGVAYSSSRDLILSPSEKGAAVIVCPVEHELFFPSRVAAFTRDRSMTYEAVSLVKKECVTAALFTCSN
jgi:hypothetical protein